MGRRKRKQVVYHPVKIVPRIFQCVACGHKTVKVKVKRKQGIALIKCGSCGVEKEVKATEISEPVDAWGEYIDIYFGEQEYDRLTKRAERLEAKQAFKELASVYSLLADISRNNSDEAAKAYKDSKSEEDHINQDKWKTQADKFAELSKDLYMKLESKELEEGSDDDVFEDIEDQQFKEDSTAKKPRRGRDIEDILDEKGFLEF